MFENQSPQGAIAILEDTTRLLRQTPLATLLCHWFGSAPFALGVLLFWNDVTQFRAADATCAIDSLLLAILLTWMNCWRAVFAGRLRRQLSGAPNPRWTRGRIWRLIASQSLLGATKLIALPLAALIVFPLGGAVAFYRYVAVLEDREDLDGAAIIAKAAKLASKQKRLNWAVLAPLTFLQLVVAVNVALTLAFLPQLVRILTGIESTFSRGGRYVIQNPLFVFLVFEVSWLAFDPFLQAVYCVLCFRAESLETGEDLRAALRRVRQSMQTVAAVLLFTMLPLHANTIPPQKLEESVHKAVQSHEYDWRLPPDARSSQTSQPPWLVSAANHVVNGFKAVLRGIGHAIDALLRWIFGKLPEPDRQSGSPPTFALHWSVYLLIAALAGMALWFAWIMRRSRRAHRQPATTETAAIRLDAEDLTPSLLPEDRWMQMAEECLREHNFRFALRALYLANLAWLGERELIAINPGKTNREYELELRRKVRGLAEPRELFAANVTAFERAWYGMYDVAAQDAQQFRARNARLKSVLAPPQGAAA